MKGYSFASLVKLVQGMMPITGGAFTGDIAAPTISATKGFIVHGRSKSDTEQTPALDARIDAENGALQQAIIRSTNKYRGEGLGLLHTSTGWVVWSYAANKTIWALNHSGRVTTLGLANEGDLHNKGAMTVDGMVSLGSRLLGKTIDSQEDFRLMRAAGGRSHLWWYTVAPDGSISPDFVMYKDKLGDSSPFYLQHQRGAKGSLELRNNGQVKGDHSFYVARDNGAGYANPANSDIVPFLHTVPSTSASAWHPMVGQLVRHTDGYPKLISFGSTTFPQGHTSAIIRAHGVDHVQNFVWRFDGGNGNFACPGTVHCEGDLNQANDAGSTYVRDIYIRSDKRVKFNERDFDSGALIDAIPAQEYDQLISRDEAGNEKHVVGWGVYAQDVLVHMPSAVSQDTQDNGLGLRALRVNYNALNGVLWKEARELRKRVAELEEAVCQLLGRGSEHLG